MSEEEIQRIIDLRISPINVSVHTTNPQLRKQMLRNINADKIFDILKRFDQAHLEINCQIVLVPDVNDKAELERTLRDLYSLENSVNSVAIVPVGLTKHREGLPQLKGYDYKLSNDLIDQVEGLQKEFLEDSGSRFAFLADEFYILAKRDLPEDEAYEGYPQLENGVGLVRNFSEEINLALKDLDQSTKEGQVTFITGTLAKDFMEDIRLRVLQKFPNYKINVRAIENDFFGRSITVAGLVTGGDIIKQVRQDDFDTLMLPSSMLRAQSDYFLDDITLGQLETALNRRVLVAEVNGAEFLKVLSQEV